MSTGAFCRFSIRGKKGVRVTSITDFFGESGVYEFWAVARLTCCPVAKQDAAHTLGLTKFVQDPECFQLLLASADAAVCAFLRHSTLSGFKGKLERPPQLLGPATLTHAHKYIYTYIHMYTHMSTVERSPCASPGL